MTNDENKETKKITIEIPLEVYNLCKWGAEKRGQTLEEILNEQAQNLAEEFYNEQDDLKELPLKTRNL